MNTGRLRGVVSMEDVIETMTGVEIVDEDDVAVDMQALAKEKSRMMRKVLLLPFLAVKLNIYRTLHFNKRGWVMEL